MTAAEIIGTISGSGVLVVILGLIKVKPLEISVWSWLFRQIGKALNGEITDYVKAVQTTLDEHLQEHEQAKVDEAKRSAESDRQRILQFGDECYEKKYHSKGSFDDILEVIGRYEKYCEDHEDFKNGYTATAVGLIKDTYKQLWKEHKFEDK